MVNWAVTDGSEIAMMIESDDMEKALGKLRGKLSRSAFKAVVDKIARKFAVVMETNAIIYPPARADSEYKRTGRLGASLTSGITRHEAYTIVQVGTNVKYAPYVVGRPEDKPGQAKIHQGIWTPMEDAIADTAPQAMKIAEKELATMLKVFDIGG